MIYVDSLSFGAGEHGRVAVKIIDDRGISRASRCWNSLNERLPRMDYHLTEHARDAIEKRGIAQEWIEKTLSAPEWVEKDTIDENLEHRLARIGEFGNRTLRVIVNVRTVPPRIVTVYFDRRRRTDEAED